MVADGDSRRSRADRLDDARALVAEHGRATRLRGPVDRVLVGVADARRAEAHEHLARAGRGEVELLDANGPPVASRTAARIFILTVAPIGKASDHAHPRHGSAPAGSACWSARRSSIGMWQRIRWSGSTSTSGGSCSSQIVPILRGQRVWKTHPRRRIRRARDVALEPDPLAPAAVDRRHGREQRLGVRVVRAVEDDVGRAELHQPPEVEDGDAVGDVADDAEVVADEEVRDATFRLQLDEQVEDRRLHRDVERARRLVADDELGSPANARAIATRCFSPPESCTGFCVSVRSDRRTRSTSSATRRSASAPRTPASLLIARSRIRRTAWRRLSAESGFWKTIWSARRSSRLRFWNRGASVRPSSSTVPELGPTIPRSVRARVVLPLPDSPTRPSVSPFQIAALTPTSACMSCPCCWNTLPRSSSRKKRRRRAVDRGSSISEAS